MSMHSWCLAAACAGQGRPSRLLPAVVATISLAVLPAASHAQSVSFQPIGFLTGASSSSATAVNAYGTVVVGESGLQAFRWVDGTIIGLGFLPSGCGPTAGRGTTAHGVNVDGTVVVGNASSARLLCLETKPFLWTPSGGMVDLGGLPGSTGIGDANGVSTDGAVVVGYSRHFKSPEVLYHDEAFRWLNGTMTGLGFLLNDDTRSSTAFGVNGDGTVVVGSSLSSTGTQAFRWVNGTMTGLGYLSGATSSQANGVSADDTIVVGTSGSQAFRWVNGTMTGLGFLPGGSSSDARGVSGNGSIVAGTSVAGGRNFAFRWTPSDGMQSIEGLLTAAGANISGWQLTVARAVSADGSAVVGEGIGPGGGAQGWMVRFARGGVRRGLSARRFQRRCAQRSAVPPQ